MTNISETASDDQEAAPVGRFASLEEEVSPYQPDSIKTGRGALPAVIRYMPHVIILWSVGYVWYQAESNLINYLTAGLLVLWSGYHLIAVKKKWPPFP